MKRVSGFSLVEVMCAILILGIGLVGLTEGITTALKSNKESELQTSAALIAAGRIEMLRTEGYLSEGDEEGDGGEGLSGFYWRQSVTSTPIDGLYEVVVVVNRASSAKMIYELRTLLFDPPYTSTQEESVDQGSPVGARQTKRRGR